MPTPFQDLNLGTVADDDTGESLRAGGTKINANFQLIEDVIHIDDTNDRIGIGTATPSHALHIVKSSSEPILESAIWTDSTLTTGVSGPHDPIRSVVNYEGTDTPTGVTVASRGISQLTNYGGAGTPVAAEGTVRAFSGSVVVRGSGAADNEHAAYFGVVRNDIGTGFTQTAAPVGRSWLCDFNIHGAVEAQQQIISGVTQFINNHFNGQPINADSYCFAAATFPGRGGSRTAKHEAATTYPLQIGYGVFGKSGTVASPTTAGFNVAFQAGGTGSAWSAPGSPLTSIIGTAFYGRDVTTAGLKLDNPGSGSPTAIDIDGGTWGTLIDLSGVTSPPAVAIMMPTSGDLRWQTDAGGNIGAPTSNRPQVVYASAQFNVGNGLVNIGSESSGGRVRLGRMTAGSASLATTIGAIYFRDGTNANTLKLVVKAGAGAEQTVLDNLPTA